MGLLKATDEIKSAINDLLFLSVDLDAENGQKVREIAGRLSIALNGEPDLHPEDDQEGEG